MAQIKNVTRDTAAPALQAPKIDNSGIHHVTDATGRKIGLKWPTPGDRFELDDAVATKTQSAAFQVSIVGCLISIDEEGYPPLWSYDDARAEFKKRLADLGDKGLQAVTEYVMIHFLGVDEKVIARAKKS